MLKSLQTVGTAARISPETLRFESPEKGWTNTVVRLHSVLLDTTVGGCAFDFVVNQRGSQRHELVLETTMMTLLYVIILLLSNVLFRLYLNNRPNSIHD